MNDLIYCQRKIPKNQWRYGLRSSAAVGCGWIATHNALRLLGYKTDIPKLIRYYEWQLPLIHGNAGTMILGPAVCMRQLGFPVKVTAQREKFDELARESDVCILYYWWRGKKKIGAHFVALEYRDGGFVGYNTYGNSTGPDPYGASLGDFLKKKGYFFPVLIGIKNKK